MRLLVALLVSALALAGLAGVATAAPPSVPTPAGPAAGAGVTSPVTLSWSAGSDPVAPGGYNWEVSATSTFATVLERNPVLLSGAGTTDDVLSGIPDGTYFWRVQAMSRDLEPGAWSAPRSFTVTGTSATVPPAPVLNPPSNGPRFHAQETITFTWSPVPGAVSYILQESTDPAFPVDTRVRQVDLLGPTTQISLNSGNLGTFKARVIAVNADGRRGAPSDLVDLSVLDSNPLPAPPTLAGSGNGTVTQVPLSLLWTHVPNHQDRGYQVQISGSSSFSSVEKAFGAVTDNTQVVPTLTAGPKFWRVRSQHGYIGAAPAYTAWSATGTFTVAATPLRMGAATFPARVFSGGEARGSVDVTGPAPSGGVTVTLSSNRPDLVPELPGSRQVPAGDTSSPVLVAPTGTTNSLRGMRVGFVTAPTPVTITAAYNGTTATSTITVLPPTLNDTPFQRYPVKATGGAPMAGVVDLEVGCFAGFCDGLAPAGGFPVSLSSSSAAATVPATLTIPAGAGGAEFLISTSPVTRSTHVTVTARAAGVTASWTLTLTPSPEPDQLTLAPASTSTSSQGQVTIPPSEVTGHDQIVRVTSSNPSVASVPPSATVSASTQVGFFDIATGPVAGPTVIVISVTGGGVTRSAELTVFPTLPTLTALTVNPASVPGGTPATGTVALAGAAPAGGVAVSLASNLPGAAAVPPTVTVPGGATSATFPVTTFVVDSTTVQLSATLGSLSQFAALGIARSAGPGPAPAAPRLRSPSNGASGVTSPVALDWDDVPNATSYEVQVDDSSSIAAPFVANPTVSLSQATLTGIPARQLWWRVRSRNAAGVFGPYSSTRSFKP